MQKRTSRAVAAAGALTLALAGCANPYDPGQRTAGGALIGAGSGAAIGALAGGGRGAAIGALAGALVGGATGAATTPQGPAGYAPEYAPPAYYAPPPPVYYAPPPAYYPGPRPVYGY